MERHGIKVVTGCKVAAIKEMGSRFSVSLSSDVKQTVDCVMFATGRGQSSPSLAWNRRALRSAKSGHIVVDDYMRTRLPSIYAIGDVTNRINLTPVAIREGSAVSETLFGGKLIADDHTNIPTAVFSDPEVGVCRPDGGAGAGALCADRHLPGHVQADESDPVRARDDGPDQACGRRHDGPRCRLPYRRARAPPK